MPDLQQFTVTPSGTSTVTIPKYTVSFQIQDSHGVVLRDFTGVNALIFPDDLSKLTAHERDVILREFIEVVLAVRAGTRVIT